MTTVEHLHRGTGQRNGNGEFATGLLLVLAAVVVNVAFAALSAVFDYPDVLQAPAHDVLARFRPDAAAVGGLFLLLAAGAALLGPIAVRLSRLTRDAAGARLAAAAATVGIAACAVQVIGLLRWPLVVPFLAETASSPDATAGERAAAASTFQTLHTVLGQVIGETCGYTLTAFWTALTVLLLRRAGRIGAVSSVVASAAAGMIAVGVLVPFGVPGTDVTNFVGYVAWSGWLIALGVRLMRRTAHAPNL